MSQTRTSLLSRIKNLADGPSWEEFDHIYRPLLMKYARARGMDAQEAEEIAQECMASLTGHIRDFERRVSFRGYLHGLVDNKVAGQLRKRQREVNARTADLEREQTTEDNPALLWERQWNRTHLLYWLNQIRIEVTPLTFHAFELYVIEERPIPEIAQRLGMTANQIYVAKHRVLAKLKERWADVADGIL